MDLLFWVRPAEAALIKELDFKTLLDLAYTQRLGSTCLGVPKEHLET